MCVCVRDLERQWDAVGEESGEERAGIHNGSIFNLLGVRGDLYINYERTGLAYYFIYAIIVQKNTWLDRLIYTGSS